MSTTRADGGARRGRYLSPRDAVERYLTRRRADASESSIYAWRYRLKLFVEWCEGRGIETASDLTGFHLDEYYEARLAEGVKPVTLEGEMWTLKSFAEYLDQLDATDGLADAVRIPDVDPADRSNDVRLDEAAATALLEHYRDAPARYGTRYHALLEVLWVTGARIGGIRGLDIRDVDLDEVFLSFRHRPETGTPLKNKQRGERYVGLPDETRDALAAYTEGQRIDQHDEHGRQPLFSTTKGRARPGTIRNWSYLATEPCLHSPCPHGKERDTCQFTHYNHASKCPSSRSPHQIRTGSITWQLNVGLPPEVVAERVNATVDVIEQHYDKETPRERFERRRRRYIDHLAINHDTDTTGPDA